MLSPTQYSPAMDVVFIGIPNIPSGLREGMGPYDPSCRLRNFICVLGVPVSLRMAPTWSWTLVSIMLHNKLLLLSQKPIRSEFTTLVLPENYGLLQSREDLL